MTGEELKNLRETLSLTNDQLAEKLGVSNKTMRNLQKLGEVDKRTELAMCAIVIGVERSSWKNLIDQVVANIVTS